MHFYFAFYPQRVISAALVLLAVTLVPQRGYGACASPSGVAGQMQFISGVMKFCDGSAWQSMKGSSASSCAGSASGKFQYVPDSDFVWYDGAACWSSKGSSLGSACAGMNGRVQWDAGISALKGCVAASWYSLKPVVAAGLTCWNGGDPATASGFLGVSGGTPPYTFLAKCGPAIMDQHCMDNAGVISRGSCAKAVDFQVQDSAGTICTITQPQIDSGC